MKTEKLPIVNEPFDLFKAVAEPLRDERQPVVDIITFATHSQYCGKTLYPEQQLLLRLIFRLPLTDLDRDILAYWKEKNYIPLDIEERGSGRKCFRELVLNIGRRGSKTFLSALIVAYKAYLLLTMNNPQKYYGIEEGKEIYLYCIARSGPQTKRTIYADVCSVVLGCKWFEEYIYPHDGVTETEIKLQTKWDKTKENALRRKGILTKPICSVRIVSLNSNSASLRGPAVICAVLTEIAHFIDTDGRLSGGAVYDAVDPAVKQFGEDGLMILESTPWAQTGKFYETFLLSFGLDVEGKEVEKEAYQHLFGVKVPSWDMYRYADRVGLNPIIRFEDIRHLQLTHPDSFWVEYGAEFASSMDAYLDGQLVDDAIDPRLSNRTAGIAKHEYWMHCDPSTTGANFGMVIAHSERIEGSVWQYEFPQSFWDKRLVVVDYAHAYSPSDFPDGVVDYIAIENDIIEMAKCFNFKAITFDQWNSAGSIQHIRQALLQRGKNINVHKIDFTERRNFDRYEILKSALLQRRVKIPVGTEKSGPHLLKLELKFLRMKNQKVEKQDSGPVTTKDLADCLGVVVQQLLGDIRQEDLFPRSQFGLQSDMPTQFQGHHTFDELYEMRGRLV